MRSYINIIRLTRPLNLVIVLLTMIVVRYSVIAPLMDSASIGMKFQISTLSFLFLVISALAITAAGNVINDYFDQKVDRINKPDRVMVGKTIKRRVAILLHQGLNIFGVLLVAVICIQTHYFIPLIIPIAIITLLWFYSPVLKKKTFIGNLTVAFCTACVPIWAALFDVHELRESYADMLVDADVFFRNMWIWVFIISGFAFIITLIREAVKDLEDMAGDKEGQYQTIPLVYGTGKTKTYIYSLITVFLLAAFYGVFTLHDRISLYYFLGLILAPTVFTGVAIGKASSQRDYRLCSYYLKFVIVAGLLLVILVV